MNNIPHWQTLCLFILIVTSSCSETIIEIDKDLIECESLGLMSSDIITLNTSSNWEAVVSDDWVTVKPTQGKKGETKIRVSAQRNDSFEERRATITIKAGKKNETILLIQDQRDAISISTSHISLSPESQEFSTIVSSNISYETNILGDWIHPITTKSLTEREYSFIADTNNDFYERTGTIEFFNDEKNITNYVYINQQANDSIEVGLQEVLFDWTGGQQTINVRANIDISYSSIGDWVRIQKTGKDKEFILDISAPSFVLHPDSLYTDIIGDKRVAEITIEGNGNSKKIRILQSFKHYIWLNKSEVSLLQGETARLDAIAYIPEGISNNLVWTSEDPNIISVENGVLNAIGVGETTITVSSVDGLYSAKCKVVSRNPISDILFGTSIVHLVQSGGATYFDFGSTFSLPSLIDPKRVSIQYVLFCRPDGTIVERITDFSNYQWYLVKNRYTLYVTYNTVINYGSLNSQVLAYFNSWYGVCFYTVDGVLFHSPN